MSTSRKLMNKTIHAIIDPDVFGWPPVCTGIIYQPPRPCGMPKKEFRGTIDNSTPCISK